MSHKLNSNYQCINCGALANEVVNEQMQCSPFIKGKSHVARRNKLRLNKLMNEQFSTPETLKNAIKRYGLKAYLNFLEA